MTCNCLGPQNGEPLCPCQMGAARWYIDKYSNHHAVWPTGLSASIAEDHMTDARSPRVWALAIKRALGNVWHAGLSADADRAWCDHRIRLEKHSRPDMPTDEYVCKRCSKLVRLQDD